MFSKELPQDFKPDFEVVGCFMEHNGKVLMLKRALGKYQPEKWGLPGGKVDPGESLNQAMRREAFEETGLDIPEASFKYIVPVYVENEYRFIYHMFFLELETLPKDIVLNPAEHTGSAWFAPADTLGSPEMMRYMDECVRLAYKL